MSRLKRTVAYAAITILASLGTVVVAQAPASANAPCPSGYACFYEHTGYTGSETDYYWGFRGSCVTFYGFWHDRISSFQNNIGGDMVMYRNAYCDSSNGSWWFYNGGSVSNMGLWGWNDTIDSVYFY